ncbi:sugar phosphate isomerase/epimerase family protein [Rhodococcus globerulus]|uniref:Sugar phosphate isomerase/epimerase family protein n=1 Tax=Rhodococcus globerulus TaxID=33008 RepID=A0ABU4C3E6_RHOGO|nr:sugar phosphate isomerase/epimerase family protein [Rhodococcus globerulus]MDV6271026.1 sugar phosphate isomerase/epimerase family protein [Rhodococcus globerulus]
MTPLQPRSFADVAAPQFAMCSYSTPHNSIYDDVEQSAAVGAAAVGLWEGKFVDGEDEKLLEFMATHNIATSTAVPERHSILGIPFDLPGTPKDPEARTELICRSIERLAKFNPAVIAVAPGTTGDASAPAGPIEELVPNLRTIAEVAEANDVIIGFELLAERRGCPVHTLPAMAEMLDEVGSPHLGIMFDVFHSWPEPDLINRIAKYAPYINSVQVCDARIDERSGFDRELPGRGRATAGPIIEALIAAGYRSYWEMEVFSDDGSYGSDFPDSYWKLPHIDFIRETKQEFERVYAAALTNLRADGRLSDS